MAGRIQLFQDVSPDDGRILKMTENKMLSIKPSQNVITATHRMAMIRIKLSKKPYCRIAESIPILTSITKAMAILSAVNLNVVRMIWSAMGSHLRLFRRIGDPQITLNGLFSVV